MGPSWNFCSVLILSSIHLPLHTITHYPWHSWSGRAGVFQEVLLVQWKLSIVGNEVEKEKYPKCGTFLAVNQAIWVVAEEVELEKNFSNFILIMCSCHPVIFIAFFSSLELLCSDSLPQTFYFKLCQIQTTKSTLILLGTYSYYNECMSLDCGGKLTIPSKNCFGFLLILFAIVIFTQITVKKMHLYRFSSLPCSWVQ